VGGARGRRGLAAALAALIVLALAPATSQAAFHLMKIREVSAGSDATSNGDFVELQMLANGQNQLDGHKVTIQDFDGGLPIEIPLAMVPNGGTQRTVLIAAGPVDGVAPDITDGDVNLPATGGAVCFDDAEPADCVAWGNIEDPTNSGLEDVQTAAAPAIPPNQSLTRRIVFECPSLLEDADDSDNSSVDFPVTAPTPRNNATVPTETSCAPPPDPPGPGPDPTPEPDPEPQIVPPRDMDPPETTIDRSPKKELKKPKATIEFSSDEAGSRFECKVGKGDFEACTSPHKLRGLKKGKNKLQVRAIDAAGNADPSPAKATLEVAKEKRKKGGKG
jgi:hypothetical protein